MQSPSIIIVGAGPAGISLAHTLKHKLKFDDFTVFEKLDGPGGTWRTNSYPGVGCDVPTVLYSFSFNLNPTWSKELCDGPEILEYIENTVDKFDLRKHMSFGVECISATWDENGFWDVVFRDEGTGIEFVRRASIFICAVGGISSPRDTVFPGMEKYKGKIFHTARWDHTYDYRNKRVAVIGNGCSAAQVVPAVIKDVAFLKQYARSAQWYHERPNRNFTSFEHWCFKYIPLWERLLRLRLFLLNDDLVATYMAGPAAATLRKRVESGAKDYIRSKAPQKYYETLVPDFPLGCKRRIFDPNYLETLHDPKMQLAPCAIRELDETGIVGADGVKTEIDLIVLATGFKVQQFLVPMTIKGRNGRTLEEQWAEKRGAQAYMGALVSNFPNFGIMFGPNTFFAHNSALVAIEIQAEYLARYLVAPIIDRKLSVVEVKETAEDQWVNGIQEQLKGSVFEAGCSNWYINKNGRNSASWPGYASTYYKEALRSHRHAFVAFPSPWNVTGSQLSRKMKKVGRNTSMVMILLAVLAIRNRGAVSRFLGTMLVSARSVWTAVTARV